MKTGLPRHLMITYIHEYLTLYYCDVGAYILALGNGREVNLDLGHGQNIGGRGHVDEEICGGVENQSIVLIELAYLANAFSGYPKTIRTHPAKPSHIPCTVAFAPAAVNAPIVPTMKYWNNKFLLVPALLL